MYFKCKGNLKSHIRPMKETITVIPRGEQKKPKKPNQKNRPELKTDGSGFTFSKTEKFGSVSVFVQKPNRKNRTEPLLLYNCI